MERTVSLMLCCRYEISLATRVCHRSGMCGRFFRLYFFLLLFLVTSVPKSLASVRSFQRYALSINAGRTPKKFASNLVTAMEGRECKPFFSFPLNLFLLISVRL